MVVNVLITGAGSVLGQSIYKAISGFDHNIYFTNSDELGAGLYFRNVCGTEIVPLASEPEYLDRIHQYVLKNNIDIIFPGTQHELRKLSEYGEQNRKVAVHSPGMLQIALDKYETSKFFLRHRIQGPRTVLLDQIEEAEFPVVIKPRTNSASRDINILSSLEEFNRESFQSDEYIVQSYIEGDEYTCGCYIDRYTKYISTIILKRELTREGASGRGEVVSKQIIDDYVKQIATAFMEEGIEFGHLNIQLRLRDDIPFCFEINGRLSSTEAPKAKLGFNSVRAYVHNIVFEKEYNGFRPRMGMRFLRFYDEVYF